MTTSPPKHPLPPNLFGDIQQILRTFVAERAWESFHTPKNLVLALTGEVGELAEHFQWLTDEQALKVSENPAPKREVSHEIADILTYLFRLADVLDIDLEQAIREKIALNAAKYPAEWARGHAQKYTARDPEKK